MFLFGPVGQRGSAFGRALPVPAERTRESALGIRSSVIDHMGHDCTRHQCDSRWHRGGKFDLPQIKTNATINFEQVTHAWKKMPTVIGRASAEADMRLLRGRS